MASGAAWDWGARIGASAYEHGRDRKEMLSDEDRRQKAGDFIGIRNANLSKLPQVEQLYGKDSQQYKDSMQAITQSQYNLGQLYHPDKAPGALQQDWHYLLEKMHGITVPKDKSNTTASAQSPTPVLHRRDQPDAPQGNAVPQGATQFMATAKPKGLVESGNIPIWNRPSVLNDDGTHSSELSISVQDDKKNEVLIPLIVDGKFLTPNGKMPSGDIPHNAEEWDKASPEWKALKMRAWQHYQQTGQHLGKFGGDTAQDDVDAYAQVLHNRGSAASAVDPVVPPAPPRPIHTNVPPMSWGRAQLLKKQAASMHRAQDQASLLAAGSPLSPQEEAMANYRTQNAVRDAQVDSTLDLAKRLGLSETQVDELKQQLVGMKNVVAKPLTGAAGQPYKGNDGVYYQNISNPDGTVGRRAMPPDWKPNRKSVRGTLINTKEHGFIQTWVYADDPSKVSGWQKVTPGRQYTGSTSSSSSTDPFGVTTSSSRSTMPVGTAPVSFDVSGMQELPSTFNGEDTPTTESTSSASSPSSAPSAAIPSTTKTPPASVKNPITVAPASKKTALSPTRLKAQVPSPPLPESSFKVDSDGHIPDADIRSQGFNPYLAQIANNILDGQDVTKIPLKDRGAAEQLAKKYGYGGQGMFTPRETLQIKEGASFLNLMANSPALKVLDNGFFANMPMMASSVDPTKQGFFGKAMTNLSAREQTPQQREFMDLYRQLDAMATGLRALVQSGRGTQKQTDLLISELPNPYNTPSSADAKRRLQLVQNELDIAAKTGHLRGIEDMQSQFRTATPKQHSKGDTVMYKGQKVVIKEIHPDGTFDY